MGRGFRFVSLTSSDEGQEVEKSPSASSSVGLHTLSDDTGDGSSRGTQSSGGFFQGKWKQLIALAVVAIAAALGSTSYGVTKSVKKWKESRISPAPSCMPSDTPSLSPSTHPSSIPSMSPTAKPSSLPSTLPSQSPSTMPSTLPSQSPTAGPTSNPSESPSLSIDWSLGITIWTTIHDTNNGSEFPTLSAPLLYPNI